MSSPGIATIVVTYRSETRITACLEALFAQTEPANAVVWDNGSPDRSAAMAEAAAPGATVVRSERNIGFAAAVNKAAARVDGHDLLLVNPDAVLLPGAIAALAEASSQHPLLAVMACRLFGDDGQGQPDAWAFPTPWRTAAGAFIGLGRAHAAGRRPSAVIDRVVDGFVPFTAALLRRIPFDALGGLDERFFVYGEDADYCYRARRAGWQIAVARGAMVRHAGGASSDPDFRAAAVLRGGDTFREKHFSPLGAWSAAHALKFGADARLSWEAVASRFSQHHRSRDEWREVRRHYSQ